MPRFSRHAQLVATVEHVRRAVPDLGVHLLSVRLADRRSKMTATSHSMTPLHVVLLVVALHAQVPPPECGPWQQCRQFALDAAAREDYETFHNLAWRAVQQTGPLNDADLMYLLARAQSLSGRPANAPVMLQRLARMDNIPDARPTTSAACGRCQVGERPTSLRSQPIRPTGRLRRSAVRILSRTRNPRPANQNRRQPNRRKPRGPSKPVERAPAAAAATLPRDPASPRGKAPPPVDPCASRLPNRCALPLGPSLRPGSWYDAVSRRFIVGDWHARKLAVIDVVLATMRRTSRARSRAASATSRRSRLTCAWGTSGW